MPFEEFWWACLLRNLLTLHILLIVSIACHPFVGFCLISKDTCGLVCLQRNNHSYSPTLWSNNRHRRARRMLLSVSLQKSCQPLLPYPLPVSPCHFFCIRWAQICCHLQTKYKSPSYQYNLLEIWREDVQSHTIFLDIFSTRRVARLQVFCVPVLSNKSRRFKNKAVLSSFQVTLLNNVVWTLWNFRFERDTYSPWWSRIPKKWRKYMKV